MSDLAARVLEGCHVAGARVIRWLEDEDPRGAEALRVLYPHCGRAHWVGITGPPGAGKSTLVDALVAALRGRGQKVGVVAVDPTSPFSGGAILGDRVRMQRHATDPGVFIRSMATRGQLGGLARASSQAGLVLDAMGHDVVIVETVGVGQDELDIASLAHSTVVVNVPGLGDEIQALKAGILEVGQVFVLNKADRPGADETEKQLTMMLHLRAPAPDGWEPPLLRTVAAREEGVADLADTLAQHRSHLERTGGLERAAADRSEHLFRELLREQAASRLLALAAARPGLSGLLEAVRARSIDPDSAARRVVEELTPGEELP